MMKNFVKFIMFSTIFTMNAMNEESIIEPRGVQQSYRVYKMSESGFNTWYKDANELLSKDKLCSNVDNLEAITNGYINLKDFFDVSIKSALFYGYWSPGWEQKAACDFAKNKISDIQRLGIAMPKVIKGLEDIASFEEEESND